MKPNLLITAVALIMTVATSVSALESPPPAAALERTSLQSPKAPRMAILTVARAGKRMLAAGERGIVLYSDDAGRNWTQAQTPTSASLTAMRFANDQQGWAVGHMGIVLHTADGGRTWVKQLDGIEAARLTLDAARKSGDERAIRDAERLVQDGADKPFFDICLTDDHTLFIVGAYNLALRSDNGGKTWTGWQKHIANPRALHLYAMRAVGSSLFIAGEQGLLLRSSDGGQNFAAINTPYKGSWFGMVAERNGGLLAYGLRGNVYLTKDLGKTWKQSNSATPVSISAGTELVDGRIVLVSQAGEVLVSADKGLTFNPLPEKTGLPLAAVADGIDGLVLGSLRGVRTLPLPATNKRENDMHATSGTHQPVIQRLEDFDTRSGNMGERALFNNRFLIVILCLIGTLLLGWQATKIQLNASFDKMIPTSHPYIANFLANRGDLPGLGNSLRIAVETKDGTIFDKEYLATLQKMNDEIYLLPGVDRPFMKSLWTTATRWAAVTEEGLEGGTVMPDTYDGSQQSLDQVRANVERSGEVGQLVAGNFKSSVIFVPLVDHNNLTGENLDYAKVNASIEQIRAKYQTDKIRIHVTGFAKVIGDLLDGLVQVLGFFAAAIIIATAMLFWYTRCVRSTLLVVACSLIAVIWQFGLVTLLGYSLDPYSVLVPFLVFAIGMSHGAQKMNGIMQDVGRGTHRVVAARYTFRRLFAAGMTALLCDAVGFAVLMIIDIQVIKDLAMIASVGVAVLIFTNLILLPILLSYVGVSPKAAERSLKAEQRDEHGAKHWLWEFLDLFTRRRCAMFSIILAVVMAVVGFAISTHLQIGDLDPGAPELRADSRYNRDNAYMVQNYAASSDILVVMVKTQDDQCTRYTTLSKVDELGWQLEQLPGVEATNSMANLSRISSAGYNEGNFKWFELIPNEDVLNGVQNRAPRELFNQSCNMLTLYVYLKDHKAETLTRVVDAVETYATANNTPETHFMLAAGSAGIEAATNIVVKKATHEMMFWVYGAVILLCWITFRSWRAVAAAVLPLVLTSILCEALMVMFGMGVKVATLPVIALGVGIGVDYALYVLSVMLTRMREGKSLSQAYYEALLFTGKVVMLTGVTLAIGVATWAFSPIKFQADMGILLAFMFIWNMLGALLLLPALAHFLLPQAKPAADASPSVAVDSHAGVSHPSAGESHASASPSIASGAHVCVSPQSPGDSRA